MRGMPTRKLKPPVAPPAPRTRAAPVRGARHEDRRIAILRTAAELFATHGYEATSLDMIADRLGMHKATLYHYIPNKETILYQCLLASFADLDEVIARVQDRTIPVVERLRLFARSLAAAQNNVYGRCLLVVGERPLELVPGGEIRHFQRRLDTTVRDLLLEGVAAGTLRPVHPGLVSAMLFGALNWVPRWYKIEGRLSVDDVADAFIDMLTRGIQLPGHAPPPATKPRARAARA